MTSRRVKRISKTDESQRRQTFFSLSPRAASVNPIASSPRVQIAHNSEHFKFQPTGKATGQTRRRGRSPPPEHSIYRDLPQERLGRDNVGADGDNGYRGVPTDDFNQFMITLVDGIRSDGAELVQSTREAVASTLHVSTSTVLAV